MTTKIFEFFKNESQVKTFITSSNQIDEDAELNIENGESILVYGSIILEESNSNILKAISEFLNDLYLSYSISEVINDEIEIDLQNIHGLTKQVLMKNYENEINSIFEKNIQGLNINNYNFEKNKKNEIYKLNIDFNLENPENLNESKEVAKFLKKMSVIILQFA